MKEARGFDKGSLDKNPNLLDWISFEQEGLVIVRTGKVEIGQGIATALRQIAAYELGVDPAQIVIPPVSTATSPDEGVTSGSFSIQHSGAAIRAACATFRAFARGLYAARFAVPVDAVETAGGRVHSSLCDQAETYWSLARDIPSDFKVDRAARSIGRETSGATGESVFRPELAARIEGRATFIHDMVMPGMLHGRVVRAPNLAATLKSLDDTNVRARWPDVHIVRDGSFMAIVASDEEAAVRASQVLAEATVWQLPDSLPNAGDLESFLRNTKSEHRIVHESGEAISGMDDLVLTATYSRPYLAHASIGPSCAIAHLSESALDVWSHSQGIHNIKADLNVFLKGISLDVPEESVRVHHIEGAGCYGHNPGDDVTFDAVLLALRFPGRPMRVQWSRADELSCGPMGSAHLVDLRARVSPVGDILEFECTIRSNGYTCRPGRGEPGSLSFLAASSLAAPFTHPVSLDPPPSVGGGADRNAIPIYGFPFVRVTADRLLEMPIRTSALRALGAFTNVWAIESFMDEIADKAQLDPVELRLRYLTDARAKAVLEAAVKTASWWGATKDEGVGRGVAFARYKGTGAWCAIAARVRVGEQVQVTDISVAADVGLVINLDGVRNQLEGGAVQSCSWALKEALQFSRSEVLSRSWSDYPILRFSEVPAVQVTVIDRPNEPSLGAGEAAQGPCAAAIGNAVFDALGVRLRDLPLTPDRILTAITMS
jgi:CO/xanthine dehydrogenase Mo-binding subunit